jgi:flagellar motor switch protein FliN
MLSWWSGASQPGITFGLCMNTLDTIEVDITVELGATTMPIHHLLRMGRGAVIELDTTEHDPLRVYANNTLIAHGEVKVGDGRLSVELTEKILRRS